MTPKRQKAEELILTTMKLMEPGGTNHDRYKAKFAAMSDVEFDKYMKDIRDNKKTLSFFAPNMKIILRQTDLLKAADHVKAEVFTKLTFYDQVTGLAYQPDNLIMVLRLPVRRTRQTLKHGISVPEGDSKVDMLTGQVAKPDQASRFSFIEMQLLYGRGMTNTITEFMKVRGGDIPAYAQFKQSLEETGEFSLAALDPNTVPRSTMTTNLLFKCMCIDSNLVDTEIDTNNETHSLRVKASQ